MGGGDAVSAPECSVSWCHRRAAPGRRMCARCLEYHRETQRRVGERKKRRGECFRGGCREAASEGIFCPAHAEENRRNSLTVRRTHVAEGRCWDCGLTLPRGWRTRRCANCAARLSEAMHRRWVADVPARVQAAARAIDRALDAIEVALAALGAKP